MSKKIAILLTCITLFLPINVFADTLKIIMNNPYKEQIQFGFSFDFKGAGYILTYFDHGQSEQDVSLPEGSLQYKLSRADYIDWHIGGVSCSIPDSPPIGGIIHVNINELDHSCHVIL
jgi:hypothetical protein